jgi:hypothetical protein
MLFLNSILIWLALAVLIAGILSAPTKKLAATNSTKEIPQIILVEGFGTAFSHQVYVGD